MPVQQYSPQYKLNPPSNQGGIDVNEIWKNRIQFENDLMTQNQNRIAQWTQQGQMNALAPQYKGNPQMQAQQVGQIQAQQAQQAIQDKRMEEKRKVLEPLFKAMIEAGDNAGIQNMMNIYADDADLSSGIKTLQESGFTVSAKGETEVVGNLDKNQLTSIADKVTDPVLKQTILSSEPGAYKIAQKNGKITKFEPYEKKSQSIEQLTEKSLEEKRGRKPTATEVKNQIQKDKIEQMKANRAIINAGSGAVPNAPANLQSVAPGEKNEAALEGLKPGDADIVKKLADYKIPFPSSQALRTGYWQGILKRAVLYDPSFDATQYKVRQQTRTADTTGKPSQNIIGLNTAAAHIEGMMKAAEALKNSKFSSVNHAENLLAKYLPVTKGLEARQGAVTSAKTKFNAVKGEMASIFKQSGATDQEIKSWNDTVDDPTTATPASWKAFFEGAEELMGGRLSALHDQYENALGKPADFHFLSEKSRKILKGLGMDVDKIDPAGAKKAASKEDKAPEARNPGETIADYLKRTQK